MTAAEAAVAQARQDGAEVFAPEQWKDALSALAEARTRVEAKDYRGAILSARDAVEKAHVASKGAGVAKTVARSATGVAEAEVRARLDEVAALREEATKSRVPEKAFDALKPRIDEAEAALRGVDATLEKGDLLGAQKAATDLKARVADLPDRFREALDAWNASHGRKPPRPATRR